MLNLKQLYLSTPPIVQNVMVSAAGLAMVKQRYGKTYYQHRAWLKDFDNWSQDHALSYQSELLSEFLIYSTKKSIYYRESLSNFDFQSTKSRINLSSLPILEKEILRDRIKDFYTISKFKALEAQTGGTTGKSLSVRFTRDDFMKRMAVLDHFKSRHGFNNLKMKKATFSGNHLIANQNTKKFWRYNHASKQMLYSTFDITEENLKFYVDNLNEFKPDALDGFFSSMCSIASYILRHEIKLTFKPIAIFPTSETITESGRKLLELAFNAPVFDQYASSEGAPFITECSEGNLHVELSTGIFENLNSSSEILVTSFTTHGTPLVRYRIGDSIEFYDDEMTCSCGGLGTLVKKINGRSDDFLVRHDLAQISHIGSLFKHMGNSLIQAQAVQSRIGLVTLLLVVDKEKYTPEMDTTLESRFQTMFGENTKLIIKHVESIPLEKSGKTRLIKNTITTQ